MIDLKDHEFCLDVVWGAIYDYADRWRRVFPDSNGPTRRELSEITGWSYSTVYRLVGELEKLGQVKCTWNHQHQSYWDGHFMVTALLVKEGISTDGNARK